MTGKTPAERARAALLLASAKAAGGSSRLAERARGAWACQHIADATADGDLVLPACEEAGVQALYLAEVPAVNAGGIALKLAQLVTQLLRDFDGYPASVANLALAASTLADAVVLADGPIQLLPGAQAGVQDQAAADHWLAHRAAGAAAHARADVPQ